MRTLKGHISMAVRLDKSNCYYEKTGVCSLEAITNYSLSVMGKTAANDLLFCPRLYKALSANGKERPKPVTAIPCECGHCQVFSGEQYVCVAAKRQLTVEVKAPDLPDEEQQPQELCAVCGGQLTFDHTDPEGDRLFTVKAVIQTTEE